MVPTELLSVFTLLILQIPGNGAEEFVSVTVDRATVRGVIEGRNGQREYYAFKGIKYAMAGRWQDPVMIDIGESTYNATKFGDNCPQLRKTSKGEELVGQEDCLFLNIFTKVLPDKSRARSGEILNPVMVYIHGGGFTSGSGDVAGPRRFMTAEEKVVLVSINYRLGVLGFLSTGERELAGNWGLFDILIALEWVQKYVPHFGGDPQRVTIFGHSAGGAAVHLLTLSPRATGKFHRAIMHSGNGFCGANLELEPLKYTQKVSTSLSCPTDPRSEMINCLKTKSTQDLLASQKKFIDFWIYPKHAVPTLDGKARGSLAILPDHPSNLLEVQRTFPVPMIIGVTQNEGLFGYATIHTYFGTSHFRNTSFFKFEILPRLLGALLKLDKSNPVLPFLADLVVENYFKNVNMTNQDSFQDAISELSELIGDILYYSCTREFLERYAVQSATSSPIYSYVFSHKNSNSPSIIAQNLEALRRENVNHPLFDSGVPHMEDMFYLFDPMILPEGTRPQVLSPLDEGVALSYTKSLITFAKSGTPSGGPDPIDNIWKPIKPGNLNYYNITSVPVPMGQDFRKREALFWLRTVPYLIEMASNAADTNSRLKGVEANLNAFQILFWIIMTLAILLVVAVIMLGVILWRKRTTGKATLE